MTARCPDCCRQYATPEDWAAFRLNDCAEPDCPWGGDRCWYDVPCGFPPDAVVDLVKAARELRGRRSWGAVADPRGRVAGVSA